MNTLSKPPNVRLNKLSVSAFIRSILVSYDLRVLATAFCIAAIASASKELPTCSMVFVPEKLPFLNTSKVLAVTLPSADTVATIPVSFSFLEK